MRADPTVAAQTFVDQKLAMPNDDASHGDAISKIDILANVRRSPVSKRVTAEKVTCGTRTSPAVIAYSKRSFA